MTFVTDFFFHEIRRYFQNFITKEDMEKNWIITQANKGHVYFFLMNRVRKIISTVQTTIKTLLRYNFRIKYILKKIPFQIMRFNMQG